MIVIGEKINSSSKSIKPLIDNLDGAAIQSLAKKQYEAGASYIDINAGTFGKEEPEKLEWLVNTIQEVSDVPFSIDSRNPYAIEKALKANKNSKPIINSITVADNSIDSILPLAVKYNTSIIALCMDGTEMPETVDERIVMAEKLLKLLTYNGISLEDIYLDPMARPVSAASHYGLIALESIRRLKKEFPGVHVTCGISNMSFGLPERKLMNQAFLVAAMTAGLDSAILDPLDRKLMAYLYAGEALLGIDDFCMEYQMKYREGLLEI